MASVFIVHFETWSSSFGQLWRLEENTLRCFMDRVGRIWWLSLAFEACVYTVEVV